MKETPLVSVIIPVYNAEKYLLDCLESISNQTYKTLEVICVNDGSTDRSLEICKAYAKKDKRVIVLDQENTGQAIARNNGFLTSKGDYICFVDSDDLVSKNYVAFLLEGIKKDNTSISVALLQTFTNDDALELEDSIFRTHLETNLIGLFAQKYMMRKMPDFVMQSITSKLFARSILEGLDFSPLKSNILEDNIILTQIMRKVKDDRISIVECPLYYYRLHSESTMQNALNRPIRYGDKEIPYPELFREIMVYIRQAYADHPDIDKYIYQLEANEFFSLANTIVGKNMQIQDQNEQLQDKDRQITEQQRQLQQKNAQITEQQEELQQKDKQIQEKVTEIDKILRSKSFRIGYTLTKPFRILRQLLKK